MAATSGAGRIISLEKAYELHAQNKALFLDARPDAWYEMGHIRSAKNLPPSQFDELFDKVMGNTPKNQTIVTYCDGEGCELSHDLAVALVQKGFTNVHVLVNGWTLWSESGLPIEEGIL